MTAVARRVPEGAPSIRTAPGTGPAGRIQTVDRAEDPLDARMLECFERRTGLPVVVTTSLNTAGRPMVDAPRDALERFGSAPVDLLAIGPFVVRRPRSTVAAAAG
jgi:carbamoyltransferase